MDPIRKPYSKSMDKFLNNAEEGGRNDNTRPSRHNFNLSKKWENHGGADPGSVLTISNTSSNDRLQKISKEMGIKHPARFPKKLVEFFVLSGTNEGDIVLDPFAGSGTTAVVAQELGREWICIDVNKDFKKLACAWIKDSQERQENDG